MIETWHTGESGCFLSDWETSGRKFVVVPSREIIKKVPLVWYFSIREKSDIDYAYTEKVEIFFNGD